MSNLMEHTARAERVRLTDLEQLILKIGHDSQVQPLSVQEIAKRIEESDWLADRVRAAVPCEGHSCCPARIHTHGCYADFGACDEPKEHTS